MNSYGALVAPDTLRIECLTRPHRTRMGEITACKPPHLLSYIWNKGSSEESEVCFELTTKGKDVALTLTHRRLNSRAETLSVAAGWHAHLDILIAQLNDEVPPGFWRNHTRLETEYDQLLANL